MLSVLALGRHGHPLPRAHQSHPAGSTAHLQADLTDVEAEERFLSTTARRLDTLGAITKVKRQTGGQGLVRAEDNLESA